MTKVNDFSDIGPYPAPMNPFDMLNNSSAKTAKVQMEIPPTEIEKETSSDIWSHFAKGFYRGTVENPLNGIVQAANHITGTKIPELHLVDEREVERSAAGRFGEDLGSAIEVFALSLATTRSSLPVEGFAGIGKSAIRMGSIGGAYTSIFAPTDSRSEHFLQDRLTNGLMSFTSYAVAAGALGKARSFSSISAGASFGGAFFYDLNKPNFDGKKIPIEIL